MKMKIKNAKVQAEIWYSGKQFGFRIVAMAQQLGFGHTAAKSTKPFSYLYDSHGHRKSAHASLFASLLRAGGDKK
jgi:hypothetical protein